jgi:cell division control protein 6
MMTPQQQLQQIFTRFVEGQTVFKDRGALTMTFTPVTIPHRDDKIAALGRIMAPALKGERPSNLFVYGKTGTGKTLVTRFVTSELEKVAAANGHKVQVIYTNCKLKKSADTEYRLIATMAKEIGIEVPFTGLPTDQVYRIFFDAVDKQPQNIILIADEIDTLVERNGDEILYNLTRMNSELKNAKLTVIGITNDLSFLDRLDPRVRSSLSEEELIFLPYNALQLQDILRGRSEVAFIPAGVEPGVIEKCAALAAQEHGDARRALDLLRVSAELAERGAETKIGLAHVDAAQEKIDIDRVVETVKAQPRQSQAVIQAILNLAKKTKEVDTGNVFDAYQIVCQAHGLKVLTQRRVSDLIAELDLFGIIHTKVISKGRYGRTRIITLNLSDSIINKLETLLLQVFAG